MESVLKKGMIKQFEVISMSILNDFLNKVKTDESIEEKYKELFVEKIQNYQVELKDSIKNDNKRKKKEKGTRKPTRYNKYMAKKMAELKESHPELSNNDKFAKIAAQWKVEKDTWQDTD